MITQFYENSEIFMTGGSGVVGKAAIEKLLRSCNVKKIYVLLRSKKGVSPEDRLVELKNSRIFKVLKECKPKELDKLVAISGNTEQEGLGISPADRELIQNVSIFFHSAASTRFVEPLKSAIRLNVRSTHEALKIAETMKHLKIFTHISTFFSNPYQIVVEDKVYPALFDWKTAIKILEYDDNDPIITAIENKVIDGFLNTYLFTKHLAEQIVNDYRLKLPVCIYKPSVVITSFDEPEPGFTETSVGLMGLLTIWGTGLLQSLIIRDAEVHLDMTPLDIGTKTLLIYTAMKSQLPLEKFIEATPVGKFSSKSVTSTKLIDQGKLFTKAYREIPLEKSLWIPNVTLTTCSFIFWLNVLFLQLLPAIILDSVLRLLGKKPFMMEIQRKLFVGRTTMDFFLSTNYQSDGVTDYEEMRQIANGTEFDINIIDEYGKTDESMELIIKTIVAGCRKFNLNEDETSIERCKQILKAKQIAYNIIRVLVALFIGRAIYRMIMARVDF